MNGQIIQEILHHFNGMLQDLRRGNKEGKVGGLALGVLEAPTPTPSPLQTDNDLNILLAPGVEMAFVRVPAGEFLMGSNKGIDPEAFDSELPQHKVYLDEYLIGKFPVTVAQFAAFMQASGYRTWAEREGSGWVYSDSKWKNAPGANWQHPLGPGSDVRQKANHPVTQVCWEDATAFCKWATKTSGKTIRLPSEAQWEKAARGTDERIYTWGNQKPNQTTCNFNMNVKDTTQVGSYSPKGDSPYGCADMAGNVWEWVNGWYDANYYRKSPERNPSGAARGKKRLVRGGSWIAEARYIRASDRLKNLPINWDDNIGFRCVR